MTLIQKLGYASYTEYWLSINKTKSTEDQIP
jgi:hypothetical protein